MSAGIRRKITFAALTLLCGSVVLGGVLTRALERRSTFWHEVAQATHLAADDDRYEWRSIDKKHWQATARAPGLGSDVPDKGRAGEPADVTDAREGTRGACAPGMVYVAGKAKNDPPGLDIEALQNKTCTQWISKDFPARCGVFDREAWRTEAQALPTRDMAFCIDRFEYPNVYGQEPMIVVTYREAQAMCSASGKRLCNESEWTFACEGEEAAPYPYGFTRDAEACVVDQPWRPFSEGALFPRDGDRARDELDRLYQGRPSGSRTRCKSAFGVYDLTGNVDEWTSSTRSTGYASVLKGGYWGPVRARCRPATRAHDETFVAYQQGFRCCADAPANATAAVAASTASSAATAPTGAPRVPPAASSDRATDRVEPVMDASTTDGVTGGDAGAPDLDGGGAPRAALSASASSANAPPHVGVVPPKSLQQAWTAAVEAGALSPTAGNDDFRDESDAVARRASTCSTGSGGGALGVGVVAVLGLTRAARRRARAKR